MVEADVDMLQQLLADGFVYTHSSGAVDGKATYLEGVKAKKFVYRKIARSQEQIQIHGNTAVVIGHAQLDLVVSGTSRVADLRYTTVWVNESASWQDVAFQATSVSR